MKKIKITALILTLFSAIAFNTLYANEEHAEATHEVTTKKFDAAKMITEHIADAHDWHIAGHLSIPLPVIIYDTKKGWSCFSSSKFEHGHASYNGYSLSGNKIVSAQTEEMGLEPSDAITDESGSNGDIYDFSITKNVASIFLTVAIMLLIFLTVAKTYKRAPGSAPKGLLQNIVEPIIVFIRDDVAKASIGEKHHARFMPYLLTAFFFIWISNLLGLIPVLGANVTGNIAVTLTLALITFVIITISGKKDYWRHVFAMPGVPVGVLVILTPIEIIGMFLRPFVLMIRLFANITAGHIIALSFFSLIFIFGETSTGTGLGVSVLSVAFTVFMMVLELLVAFLQAYVFTLLSAVYFGSAVEEHHHDDHH